MPQIVKRIGAARGSGVDISASISAQHGVVQYASGQI
jgi:hypothetical protein